MREVPLVPGAVADHVTCLLTKLGQVSFRLCEESLAQFGLRVRHYSILQALADNGPMSQLALGTFLRIDPATMVSSLDDLEREKYALRERDPGDRRRYVVEITASGRKVLTRINACLDGLDTELMADLSADDLGSLHRILRKLSDGDTLPTLFDASRDQAGQAKTPSAAS